MGGTTKGEVKADPFAETTNDDSLKEKKDDVFENSGIKSETN